ncbi:MAG TPA: outer membrane protein [Devosia sp.]|jgi:outer membrane immunogenic protein|uniref:outer membrane protein n=1 Tax=Devosia sp. TaxID=1871048 RepID=UPI002F93FA01
MLKTTTVAVLAILATPVLAADLVIPSSPEPIYEDAGFDWSGAYIGAWIGGQGVRLFAPGEGTIEGTGALGGVFAGFNAQSGNLVFGGEADVDYSGFNGARACGNPLWTCRGYVNSQGSARARFGVAVDTLLFYGTAGVALGNAGGSTTSPAGVVFSDASVRVGYTVGAGVEMAFSDNLTGRLEYRYTNLGARNMNFDVVYPNVEVSSHTVRAGLAYKF